MIYTNPDAILLIGKQFAETAVVECLATMRANNLSILLVGLKVAPIVSCNNIIIQSDLSLSQLPTFTPQRPRLLILAGGEQCAQRLLSDPRVHRLMQHIRQTAGLVAGMSGTEQPAVDTGINIKTGRYRFQTQIPTADFIRQLINHVKSWSPLASVEATKLKPTKIATG